MFKKLRNKIVAISMVSTTIVLILAFVIIYSIVSTTINNRPMPKEAPMFFQQQNSEVVIDSQEFEREQIDIYIKKNLLEDRKDSLNTLLVSLIVTGVFVEVLVFIISLYLADQSIKPVKETYEAQKQFIANASHEIKTPIAVIQANLEAADISGNEWIDNAMTKAEELAELNNQLLTLARAESGVEDVKKTEIVPGGFVKELVAPLKPQIEKKKIKLTVKNEADKKFNLNEPAFRQILNILLDNAIKYSDKKITIKVKNNEIVVSNDGTIISEEEAAHLFERFYQVDKTKNGVGLGLAIAHEVAEKNNWKLSATSDKKSTSFILNF